MTGIPQVQTPSLGDLRLCFEGAIPAVVVTAAADGTPNVTFLSRVRLVDDERIALSNQFFSKTTQNLIENPRASVMLMDPVDYGQYRLALAFERTERKGRVFDLLRDDVAAVAAMQGMEGVFNLRGADIYRVLDIEVVPGAQFDDPEALVDASGTRFAPGLLGEMSSRLSRCADLDTLVTTTVDGLAELFGYAHSMLLLLDEEGTRLYTIASHGYEAQGVGSEIEIGAGVIGMAAAQCAPIRLGNLSQLSRYGQTVRHAYEAIGEISPGHEVPFPGLTETQSRLAVPAMTHGQLVGVLVVESRTPVAYSADDEALLMVVATLVAGAIEIQPGTDGGTSSDSVRREASPRGQSESPRTRVRFFVVDGSVFIDGEYLIKGVAGRLLWTLLQQYDDEGRVDFTNREVRLDSSLELPEFRDNFESRLVLLKRRLEERHAPITIEKTGRGHFRLAVEAELNTEFVPIRG